VGEGCAKQRKREEVQVYKMSGEQEWGQGTVGTMWQNQRKEGTMEGI